MNKVVIIAGSRSDEPHVEKIAKGLREECQEVECLAIYASAHREPLMVLKALEDHKGSVFITVAGRSNALSGVVSANCDDVVIACPPFADLSAYMVDIHSTLRMPSGVPVLTIVDPFNCASAVARILRFDKD